MKKLILIFLLLAGVAQGAVVPMAGNKYVGLSGDSKPTTVAAWSTFYETDTLKQFIYTGGSWSELSDGLGSATYSDVVGLWTTCSGYLKDGGSCDTPTSMVYTGSGVAVSTGSAWTTSLSTDGSGDCSSGAVCLGDHTHTSYAPLASPSFTGNVTHTGTLEANSIINGTFDTDASWTKGTGWTIDAGDSNNARATATTGNLNETSSTVVAGKYYKLTWDAVATSGTYRITAGGQASDGGVAAAVYSITGSFVWIDRSHGTSSLGQCHHNM